MQSLPQAAEEGRKKAEVKECQFFFTPVFSHVDVKAKRSGCSDLALKVCLNQAASSGKANDDSLDHAKHSPEAGGCDFGVFSLEVLSSSGQWLSHCWGN